MSTEYTLSVSVPPGDRSDRPIAPSYPVRPGVIVASLSSFLNAPVALDAPARIGSYRIVPSEYNANVSSASLFGA